MATCESCGETLLPKLAQGHSSDDIIDITFFPSSESGEPLRSVPRNYYCSTECAIEGLRDEQPQQATKEAHERREELLND